MSLRVEGERRRVEALEATDPTVAWVFDHLALLSRREVAEEIVVRQVVVGPQVHGVSHARRRYGVDHPRHPLRYEIGLSTRQIDHPRPVRIPQVSLDQGPGCQPLATLVIG